MSSDTSQLLLTYSQNALRGFQHIEPNTAANGTQYSGTTMEPSIAKHIKTKCVGDLGMLA